MLPESLSIPAAPQFGAGVQGAFSPLLTSDQFPLLIISALISLALQITGLNFTCHTRLTLWQGHGKTTIIICSCFPRLISTHSPHHDPLLWTWDVTTHHDLPS